MLRIGCPPYAKLKQSAKAGIVQKSVSEVEVELTATFNERDHARFADRVFLQGHPVVEEIGVNFRLRSRRLHGMSFGLCGSDRIPPTSASGRKRTLSPRVTTRRHVLDGWPGESGCTFELPTRSWT